LKRELNNKREARGGGQGSGSVQRPGDISSKKKYYMGKEVRKKQSLEKR